MTLRDQGLKAGQWVDFLSACMSRRVMRWRNAEHFLTVPYDIPRGCVAASWTNAGAAGRFADVAHCTDVQVHPSRCRPVTPGAEQLLVLVAELDAGDGVALRSQAAWTRVSVLLHFTIRRAEAWAVGVQPMNWAAGAPSSVASGPGT